MNKKLTLEEFPRLMSDGRQVWAYVDESGNQRLYVLMSVESYIAAQQAAKPIAADYTPPCPDCGVPMAEQRPGSYECLEEGCGMCSA